MSIHAKLLAAQKAITAIGKTGHNQHFNYKFFEEREVLRVAREALNDAGLAFLYSVEDVSDREVQTAKGKEELLTDVRMTCTLFDSESGESVTGKAIGRGQDGQDKGINKAIVAGLKYWLLKTLMIPTDDDTERDEHTNAEGNAVRVDKRTGEIKEPVKANGAAQEGEEWACPTCEGPVWDNRKNKKSAKGPDWKCRDKACDWAMWIATANDELTDSLNALAMAGAIQAASVEIVMQNVMGGDLGAYRRAWEWVEGKREAARVEQPA